MKSDLADELVRFGEDQLKTLGKYHGGQYIKRCLTVWQASYGDAVVTNVRSRLMKIWKEMK